MSSSARHGGVPMRYSRLETPRPACRAKLRFKGPVGNPSAEDRAEQAGGNLKYADSGMACSK